MKNLIEKIKLQGFIKNKFFHPLRLYLCSMTVKILSKTILRTLYLNYVYSSKTNFSDAFYIHTKLFEIKNIVFEKLFINF